MGIGSGTTRTANWTLCAALLLITACSQSAVVGTATPEAAIPPAATVTVPTVEPTPVEIGTVPDNAQSKADLSPRGMAFVEPAPDTLPSAFSEPKLVGDTGVYYAAIDGRMLLVAFDAVSLEPLYQVPAHPLGRIRGVGQGIVTDADLGLVFLTGDSGELSDDDAFLAALDARTGEELWRTTISYETAQPRDCGSALCVRSRTEEVRIDKASGAQVSFVRVTDRRVLLHSDELSISTASRVSGSFASVSAHANYGTDRLWTISDDEIAAAGGTQANPDFGWRAERMLGTDTVLVFLAAAESDGWVTLAIGEASGEIQWARLDLSPCVISPLATIPGVVCVVSADDAYVTESVIAVDPASGEARWSFDIDPGSPELIYDGTDIVLWVYADDGTSTNSRIDPASGRVTVGPRTELCSISEPWHEFSYPDGTTASWASSTLYTMCSNDGYLLYADEVLTMSPTLALETDQPLWLVDGSTYSPLTLADS